MSKPAVERLRDVLRRQHLALSTESTYVYWLRQYVRKPSTPCLPRALRASKSPELFLTNLARHRSLSATSQNQAFNAVLCSCDQVFRQPLQGVDALHAKRPARLRRTPAIAETQALLQIVRDRADYPTI